MRSVLLCLSPSHQRGLHAERLPEAQVGAVLPTGGGLFIYVHLHREVES